MNQNIEKECFEFKSERLDMNKFISIKCGE